MSPARFVALVALGALLAGPAPGQEPPPGQEVPAEAYATVDGAPVLRAEVDRDVARGMEPDAALRAHVTQRVIAMRLRREGHDPADVSDAALEEAAGELRDRLRAQFGPDAPVDSVDPEDLRVPVAFRAFVRSRLTDEALQRYFQARRLLFAGEVRARHIALRGEDASALRARAEALIEELKDQPDAAFAARAREVSDDPLGPVTGGDLDWFGPDGRTPLGMQLPRALVRPCFERGEPGVLPEPVETSYGVHVVRVTRVRVPEGATLAAHRDEVAAAAAMAFRREVVEEWRRQARIQYADDAPR